MLKNYNRLLFCNRKFYKKNIQIILFKYLRFKNTAKKKKNFGRMNFYEYLAKYRSNAQVMFIYGRELIFGFARTEIHVSASRRRLT